MWSTANQFFFTIAGKNVRLISEIRNPCISIAVVKSTFLFQRLVISNRAQFQYSIQNR